MYHRSSTPSGPLLKKHCASKLGLTGMRWGGGEFYLMTVCRIRCDTISWMMNRRIHRNCSRRKGSVHGGFWVVMCTAENRRGVLFEIISTFRSLFVSSWTYRPTATYLPTPWGGFLETCETALEDTEFFLAGGGVGSESMPPKDSIGNPLSGSKSIERRGLYCKDNSWARM